MTGEPPDRGWPAAGGDGAPWPSACPVCVVVNPEAGAGHDRPRLERILTGLPDAVVRTARGGDDTARLARAAEASGCRRLVAVGGDGTLHRIVSALRDPAAGPCLGLVPTGTGNDFARALALPRDPGEAARVAARGEARPVDLMSVRVGGRDGRAVNFVVGGAGGDVARHVTAGRKRRWRRLVYLRAAVAEVRGLRPRDLVVEADGTTVSSGAHLAVLVANGPTLGAGLPAAPRAEVDDGLLDVVAVRGSSAVQLAGVLARLLAGGRHLRSPRVTWRRAEQVSIRGDRRLPFNADGEAAGAGEAAVRVVPEGLRVSVPPHDGQLSAGARPSKR